MSSAITEASTWETQVVAPEDGDARNAASVRTPIQDVTNRTKWLREKLLDIQGAQFTTVVPNTYTGSSYVNVVESADWKLTFTDVKSGDKIRLAASVSPMPIFTGGTGKATLRFGNTTGSLIAVGVCDVALDVPGSLTALFTAAADAASLDLFLQINPNGATSVRFAANAALTGELYRKTV